MIEKDKLEKKYSFEALVSSWERNHPDMELNLSASTLRRYDKSVVIFAMRDKKRKKSVKVRKRPSCLIPEEKSIEHRPEEVRDRKSFGHWEMDCVIGRKEKSTVLLTLVERSSRYTYVLRLQSKTGLEVKKALDQLEFQYGSRFRDLFKTITCDNGSEFRDHRSLEQSILGENNRTTVYYCHPYVSNERGTNENMNRMVRRWFPKGSDFNRISPEEVQVVQRWINDYPRPLFDGLSSSMISFDHQLL